MFKNMDELKRLIGPDVEILDDGAPPAKSPKRRKRQGAIYTEAEKQLAQDMTSTHDTLWVKARTPLLDKEGERYADLVGCLREGGFVTCQIHWHPSADSLWTRTETLFYLTYLRPMLESGAFEIVIPQVAIYMPGQRVTVDFVAFDYNGICYHYEVKGKYALGSQSRASAKYRWFRYYLDVIESPHLIYWATMTKSGDFNVKEIAAQEKQHPLLGNKQSYSEKQTEAAKHNDSIAFLKSRENNDGVDE